jgi:hypothetical protein
MAKGPEITDEVKALASKLHEEHPKWTNSMIRNELLSIMHQRKPSLPKNWPSKYSIDRIMPEIREQVRQSRLSPNPVDGPWSTTTMGEYYIPPEALPTVLALWGWMRETLDYHLTIREAQWAARLNAAADKVPIGEFSLYCRAHATTEMIYERIGASREPWPHLDLIMLRRIFGTKMTREHEEKILGKDKEAADKLLITMAETEVTSAVQHADLVEQVGAIFGIYEKEGKNEKGETVMLYPLVADELEKKQRHQANQVR